LPDNQNRARDHLANERTFLAWVRAGVATIVFGFVIGRFSIALREFMKIQGYASATPGLTTWLGIISAVGGVLLIMAGLGRQGATRFEHLRARRLRDRPCILLAWFLRIGAGGLSRVHRNFQQMNEPYQVNHGE
jgi:uncharacterized membrane protein YidH (DUF202 family)